MDSPLLLSISLLKAVSSRHSWHKHGQRRSLAPEEVAFLVYLGLVTEFQDSLRCYGRTKVATPERDGAQRCKGLLNQNTVASSLAQLLLFVANPHADLRRVCQDMAPDFFCRLHQNNDGFARFVKSCLEQAAAYRPVTYAQPSLQLSLAPSPDCGNQHQPRIKTEQRHDQLCITAIAASDASYDALFRAAKEVAGIIHAPWNTPFQCLKAARKICGFFWEHVDQSQVCSAALDAAAIKIDAAIDGLDLDDEETAAVTTVCGLKNRCITHCVATMRSLLISGQRHWQGEASDLREAVNVMKHMLRQADYTISHGHYMVAVAKAECAQA